MSFLIYHTSQDFTGFHFLFDLHDKAFIYLQVSVHSLGAFGLPLYKRIYSHVLAPFFGHQSTIQEQHHHGPEEQAGYEVGTDSHEAALQGIGIGCLWR